MNYGNILNRAWKITRRHKALWLFGFLAGCGVKRGGSSGTNWQSSTSGPGGERLDVLGTQLMNWMEWLLAHPAVIVALLGVLALFSLLAWVLGAVGIGGLVKGVAQADEKPQDEIHVRDLWAASLQFLTRLLGLSFVNGGIIFLSLLVFFGPGVAMMIAGGVEDKGGILIGGMALFCGGFLVWLAVVLVWGVVYFFARFAVVLEEEKVLQSLIRGWQVFWHHLGDVVIMGLILFIARMAAGILSILSMTPGIVAWFRWMQGADIPLLPIIAVNAVIAIPFNVLLTAVFETFHIGAWTLAYREMTAPPAEKETEAIVALEEGNLDAATA